MIYAYVCLFIIAAYLIGSIPTGYLIVKKLKGIDIRETGSGSTGATNVKRILGTKWFFAVMALDALKGGLLTYIAVAYFDLLDFYGLIPVLTAIATILGHCKPIFLNFKGGKSVATGIGTLIALNWIIGLICAAVWAAITYFSKYVSLGSIVAVCLAPILMNLFHQNDFYICYAAILAIFVVLTHKDNIKRLLNNQENKIQ